LCRSLVWCTIPVSSQPYLVLFVATYKLILTNQNEMGRAYITLRLVAVPPSDCNVKENYLSLISDRLVTSKPRCPLDIGPRSRNPKRDVSRVRVVRARSPSLVLLNLSIKWCDAVPWTLHTIEVGTPL